MINKKYFVVSANNQTGVLDKIGSTIIPFMYELVLDEYNDMFIAKKEGKYGIVNQYNETIVPFSYITAKKFVNGLVMVSLEKGKYHLIDTNNNKRSQDFKLFGMISFNGHTSFYKNDE